MGKDYCTIKDCHNTSGNVGRFGKKVKLHHLPKNKALRSVWLRAVSRKHFKPTSYTQICSDHFPDGDGRTWEHKNPTLFLPQRTEKELTRRTTMNSQNGIGFDDFSAPSDVLPNLTESEEETTSANFLNFHSYSLRKDSQEDTPGSDTNKTTQSSVGTDDQEIQVSRPEITIEDIQSDCDIQFYTGLPNITTVLAGDAVMVDKGFINLMNDFKGKNIKLYCPPFLSSSSQLRKAEVECTRRVAAARIHVESKMEQINKFKILQSVLPISLSNVSDSIFVVCSALTNVLPPLVK